MRRHVLALIEGIGARGVGGSPPLGRCFRVATHLASSRQRRRTAGNQPRRRRARAERDFSVLDASADRSGATCGDNGRPCRLRPLCSKERSPTGQGHRGAKDGHVRAMWKTEESTNPEGHEAPSLTVRTRKRRAQARRGAPGRGRGKHLSVRGRCSRAGRYKDMPSQNRILR